MFWDRVAGIYDLFGNIYNGKVNREMCRIVVSQIGKTDSVLECACGTGMLSEQIAQKCRKLIATDFSQGMLKQARRKCRKYENVRVRYADIMNLDFPDNSFDLVIAANVIHLLDKPGQALKELDRVCKPAGKLIIPTYVNNENRGRTAAFARIADKAGADFKRQFTYSNYEDYFIEAGYEDIEIKLVKGRIPCAIAFIRKKQE